MIFSNGDIYEGSWSGDDSDVIVKYYINGYGKMIYSNKEQYEGEFENSKRNGEGEFIYQNGNIYIGSWFDDLPNGVGKLIFSNGDVYEGNFTDEVR